MARRPKIAPPPGAELLTAKQERDVRAALKAGATRDEAAALIGITRQRLDTRLRDQLSDVRVGRGRRERNKRTRWQAIADPTQEEIAQRAAEIRARWTPEEELEHRLNFSGPLGDA